ncbi:hypothetical protein GCM10025760_24610 [Microbacterium yannicii]|uniref:Uncharacterized protein n=1 Tax=Microbacterium yannicii TaxID=671622 RepID=A0ABP9MD89_9MICO|nr:hypothetical protein [Microbacterium yannicii]MCO5952841.1 hypothetical protein [Microbacterium yannicii]
MADRADWEDVDGVLAGEDAPADVDADVDVDEPDFADASAYGMVDDDPFMNSFTDEIMNVTASDWDVDADSLWGVEPALDPGTDPSPSAFDLPV